MNIEIKTMQTNVELDRIKELLNNSTVQKELISLYSDSQAECSRNGKCTMEIGTSRENDFKAVCQDYIGNDFITDIDNSEVEDCRLNGEKISIKHISGSFGGGSIKAKWTSDTEQAKKFINDMISSVESAETDHYTHLILIWIDVKKKKITICCVSSETVRNTVKSLGTNSFTSATGTNNRGVEYSKKMISELINNSYFTIEMKDITLTNGDDPVLRRRKLLSIRRSYTVK